MEKIRQREIEQVIYVNAITTLKIQKMLLPQDPREILRNQTDFVITWTPRHLLIGHI